jgi:myo-inositol-1(or 4)-monophosphatase
MADYEENELLDVARRAALAGAEELLTRFGERAEDIQTKTTPTDLVSEADMAAEGAIRDVLRQHRPADAILAEESGASGGEGENGLRWVVDPLDGTINFLFGIPAFAVSVACEDAGRPVAAVVLDPVRQECFTATAGGQARLNGEAIQGSERDDLSRALVATGFGYDVDVRTRQAVVVSRVLARVRDIRRVGAAALDLAWCACGRFDAYYERGVQPWDVAAGSLIAARSGLAVRTLPATQDDAKGIVAAPPAIVDELFELVVAA